MHDSATLAPDDDNDHEHTSTNGIKEESHIVHATIESTGPGSAPPVAIVNGHNIEDDDPSDHPDAPPSKRRRLTESSTAHKNSPRAVSPPWKSVAADGPTTFLDNGKRRSGRTNVVPLELQPQSGKRQTRKSFAQVSDKHAKPTYNSNRKPPSATPASNTASNAKHARTTSADKSGKRPTSRAGKDILKDSPTGISKKKEFVQKPAVKTPASPQRKLPSRAGKSETAKTKAKVEPSSSEEASDDSSSAEDPSLSPDSSRPPTPPLQLKKVLFRVRVPKPSVSAHKQLPEPRKYANLDDFLENDKTDDPAWRPPATAAQIAREAAARYRLIKATDSVAAKLPPKQLEPARQYAHHDHLVAHALYFRGLMKKERKDHLRVSHQLALEAKRSIEEKAKKGRVKTSAELEHEQWLQNLARYRIVIKDVSKMWQAVDAEVQAIRAKQFEEQEHIKSRQRMDLAIERSEAMVKLHGAGLSLADPGMSDDDTHGSGTDDDDMSEDSEDMSASDAESEKSFIGPDDPDADMTAEELKAKYAALPDLQLSDDQDDEGDRDNSEEDSDPETVMDSEMDSDDSDNSGDDSDDNDAEEEEEEEEGGGLLSMLFSKKQIAKLEPTEKEKGAHEPCEDPTDVVMANESDEDVEASVHEINVKEALPENKQEVTLMKEELMDGTDDNETLVNDVQDNSIKDIEPTTCVKAATDEGDLDSREQSDRTSPETVTSKITEPESASSVEQTSKDTSKSSITTPVPPLLRGNLRIYQHEGLDWLAKLYATGRSGILADEMGLGKTIQSISLLAHLATTYEVWGPHLIIVPTSVMLNWEMEFKKFLPGFKLLVYYGSQEERKQKRRGWMADDSFNVCITSYQLVIKDASSFKRRRWHYMILDEAHNIKNFKSERWQTMMTFNTRARLLLTGTPLQNNLTELWSLLFFLHYGQETQGEDGPFAGLTEWSEWFKKPVQSILDHGKQVLDAEDRAQVEKLHQVIRPFLLRRLKRDVEKQMPLKYEHVELCRLSKRQRQLYDGFMSRAQTKETLASGNYLSIINALMQLRKVCNHPDLFETRPINTSFALPRSVVTDFEIRDLVVRRRFQNTSPLDVADLDFLQLAPLSCETMSKIDLIQMSQLNAYRPFQALREKQWDRFSNRDKAFVSTDRTRLRDSLETAARSTRLNLIDRTMYYEAYKHYKHPIYGSGILSKLNFDIKERILFEHANEPTKARFWDTSTPLNSLDFVDSVSTRSQRLSPLIEQFACVTPNAVAVDMPSKLVTEVQTHALQEHAFGQSYDPFHQAQMKLSIAFPDKRLLQYDCGKLQRLAKLLRQLQSGGHRALIFTQMTKMLDILEQFLNIHGHKYLRLDGATPIEKRQSLTERFNSDPKILCFILSSRSGGLGINLTGADSVIFYDLDWNPAMDKQCTDRAHRIGQTRDVHIYRFVSEHTIEANILRKANQKQILDDVVIQEGEFTTDYFNKLSYKDMLDDPNGEGDMASAAMDRVLGGDMQGVKRSNFEQAEDKEDIAAARVAANEDSNNMDVADFDGTSNNENKADPYSATNAAIEELNNDTAADGVKHIDDYLLRLQLFLYKSVPLSSAKKDRKKSKKKRGAEVRIRR